MAKEFNVVLVVPNLRWIDSDINALWHYVPYNLCILGAMIEPLCRVSIIDAYKHDMSPELFSAKIRESRPDVVGLTILMDQYAEAGHQAARLVKAAVPGAKVILGGVYATMNPLKAAEDVNVDYVMVGEGEYAFRDLILHFKGERDLPEKGLCFRRDGKLVNSGRAEFIKDLDALPLPAYHLIDFLSYANAADRKSVDAPPCFPYARLLTSRGCPYGCVFCQVESIMGKKFRSRSAENVLSEIRYLKGTYGVRSLMFDDDNLFTDKARAKAIFRGMIEQGLSMPWLAMSVAVFRLDEEMLVLMKQSGCEYINIAIESGSKRVLTEIVHKPVDYDHAKEMVRLAKREGLYVAANFIVGFPTETWDEIRTTVRFAEELGIDYMKLFAAIPLENTRLWDLCVKEGAFKKNFSESGRHWSSGQIETKDFSSADLTFLRAYEWDRVNFSDPEKRRKTAARMKITEEELLRIRRGTLDNAKNRVYLDQKGKLENNT